MSFPAYRDGIYMLPEDMFEPGTEWKNGPTKLAHDSVIRGLFVALSREIVGRMPLNHDPVRVLKALVMLDAAAQHLYQAVPAESRVGSRRPSPVHTASASDDDDEETEELPPSDSEKTITVPETTRD